MQNLPKVLIGIFFIVIGLLAILGVANIIELSWKFFWPFFVIIPGIGFESAFFAAKRKGTRVDPGILVPGGVLTTVGTLLLINSIFDFAPMQYLWPIFILAPAVGLFQLYIFGGRDRGVLFASGILTVISTIFLMISLASIPAFSYFLAAVFIAVGIYLIFITIKKKN